MHIRHNKAPISSVTWLYRSRCAPPPPTPPPFPFIFHFYVLIHTLVYLESWIPKCFKYRLLDLTIFASIMTHSLILSFQGNSGAFNIIFNAPWLKRRIFHINSQHLEKGREYMFYYTLHFSEALQLEPPVSKLVPSVWTLLRKQNIKHWDERKATQKGADMKGCGVPSKGNVRAREHAHSPC